MTPVKGVLAFAWGVMVILFMLWATAVVLGFCGVLPWPFGCAV